MALSLTSACFKLDTFMGEAKTVLAFEDDDKVKKDVLETILLVGLKIMDELKCELRAVTPFCFIGYFVYLLEIVDIDAAAVVEILNRMHFGSEYIQCTRFKPSVKAGCAILAVLSCTTDPQEYQKRIARSEFVQEEHLLECIALTASLRKRHARGTALLEEHFVIKGNPNAPRPPADVMELIINAGGVEVKLVIEKDLLANDLSDNCNRFAIPVDKVTERGFLTDGEAASLVIGTGRQLKKGIKNVPLLQPNRETVHVTLKYWKPNHYVLCNTWGKVYKNGTNQLAKGTKVQLWSYRVSGKLHLALIRIPQGQ